MGGAIADTSFWNEAITLGVAMLGAGLGIMNTWQALNANRVKLRVKPAFAIGIPQGQSMFSIEVVNLSNFPITVSEVGLWLPHHTSWHINEHPARKAPAYKRRT